MDAWKIAVVVEGVGLLATILVVAYRLGSFTTRISTSIDNLGRRLEDAHADAVRRIGENKSRLDNHSERLRETEQKVASMAAP